MFRSVHGREYTKKLVFHVLLLLSVMSDIPMYIDFIIRDDYEKSTYAFHNFKSALLFMAYSIMIRDWSKALFEMNEFRKVPILLSKWSLILVNICFTLMALVSFVYLFIVKDLDEFLHSVVYQIGMYFQIAVPFTLSAMMLHTGLHLLVKIQGAVNNVTSNEDVLRNFNDAEYEEEVVDIMYDEGGEEYGVELLGVDPNVLKLSVLIDGVTYPPEEMSLSLVLFDQVVLTQPHPPKGGFLCAESTDVTIEASGLPPCESAIIRIRGESGEPIVISGTVSEDLSSITIFLIDGGLGDLQGEIRNKKETWYFLDVSVDGTNFDESETAILQIKH